MQKSPNRILIIIPVYNESASIVRLIFELVRMYPKWDILVVNDASQDRSGELAEETGKVTVINLPFNLGIGGCVQTGFKYARNQGYDIALQFDGDGQHRVEEIRKLVKPVREGLADVVIGSRFNSKEKNYEGQLLRRVGIKIFELLSFVLIRQKITDHTSGFRAFNKRALNFLAEHYPTDFPEPEVVILLGKNRFRMIEVFTQMLKRQGGVSSIPFTKGPYYMIKVMLSMVMAAVRSRIVTDENLNHEKR